MKKGKKANMGLSPVEIIKKMTGHIEALEKKIDDKGMDAWNDRMFTTRDSQLNELFNTYPDYQDKIYPHSIDDEKGEMTFRQKYENVRDSIKIEDEDLDNLDNKRIIKLDSRIRDQVKKLKKDKLINGQKVDTDSFTTNDLKTRNIPYSTRGHWY